MLYTLRFFSSKCSLFHNANLFGFCITHILYIGCAKIKKNNSGAKRLKNSKFFLKHAVYYRKYVYVPVANYPLYKYQTVMLFGRITQRVQGGLFSCLVTDATVQSFFITK